MAICPLGAAVLGNHPAVVSFLLENGADKHFERGGGEEPLAQACANGSLEIAKLILGHNVRDSGKLQEPAIVQAARNGHLQVVTHLLDTGVSTVNLTREEGYMTGYGGGRLHGKGPTPLIAASETGQLAVVQHLVANGADLDAGYC